MRIIVCALAALFLVSCKQNGSTPVSPTLYRSWTNANVLDDNDAPAVGELNISETTASFTFKYTNGTQFTCDCSFSIVGDETSGTATLNSCVARVVASGHDCTGIQFTLPYETDGTTYLDIGTSAAKRWTPL